MSTALPVATLKEHMLHPRLTPQIYGSSTPWCSICSCGCHKSRSRGFTCRGAGMAPADLSTAASLGEVSACTSTSSLPVAFIPLSRATCMPPKHHFLDPGQASSHRIAIIRMTDSLLPYAGHIKTSGRTMDSFAVSQLCNHRELKHVGGLPLQQ